MREIAAQVTPQAQSGEQPVAVFNQLGFTRTGLVEMHPGTQLDGLPVQSVRTAQGNFPLQQSDDGGWLFLAGAGSLGYQTYYLSSVAPQPSPETVSIKPTGASDSYVLQSSFLAVEVSAASNLGIDYIYDLKGPTPQVNVLGGISNQVAFYDDAVGTNYRYSSENSGSLTQSSVAFDRYRSVWSPVRCGFGC